jgi:hypothetical protein
MMARGMWSNYIYNGTGWEVRGVTKQNGGLTPNKIRLLMK